MYLIEACKQAHEAAQHTGLIDRSLGILATTLHICLLASKLTQQDVQRGKGARGARVALMAIITLLALLTLLAVMDAVICTCS